MLPSVIIILLVVLVVYDINTGPAISQRLDNLEKLQKPYISPNGTKYEIPNLLKRL